MTHDARERLVRAAEAIRGRAKLSPGYHVVVVVTDPGGEWCGVSSSADDEYTTRMLTAALHGADAKRHTKEPIETTLSFVEPEQS